MRSTIKYVFIALAMMLAGTVSAKANAHWSCIGAEYVCGSKSASTSNCGYTSRKYRSAKKCRYSRKAKYNSNRRYRSAAKRRSYKKRSYSSGLASYYWQPQRVASGGWFNPNALTAAHKTLPFGTRVRVTNKRNGRSVVVTINDRGPFVRGRIIDLSKRCCPGDQHDVRQCCSGISRRRWPRLGRSRLMKSSKTGGLIGCLFFVPARR